MRYSEKTVIFNGIGSIDFARIQTCPEFDDFFLTAKNLTRIQGCVRELS